MKKRLWITALSACVLLTGCDLSALSNLPFDFSGLIPGQKQEDQPKEDEKKEDEGEKKEEEGEEDLPPAPVVPEGSMSISELPASLFPGDVLDLDDYVTLFLINDFSVELAEGSENLATVEGHKLTVTGEGNLEFSVKAGKFVESFQYDTMHQLRKDFVKLFDGLKNRYTVDVYEPQYDDDDNYIGMSLGDTLFHSSNYVLSFTSFGTDEQGNLIPGGILRFSEDSDSCYMFELLEDDNGEYVELVDSYSAKLLEYYNSDFSVDFSKAKYEYDSKNDIEMMVVEDEEAETFAENTMFIPNGSLSLNDGTSIPFSRIEFYFQDISEEGEEPLIVPCYDSYVLYQGKNEYWNTGIIRLDEKRIGYPLLEKYCVPENEPAPFDYYNEFFEGIKLSDLLVFDKSVFGPEGLYQLQYGWFNDDGEAIEQPADCTNFFGGELPAGSNVRYTSNTSIWEVGFDSQQAPYPVSGKTTVNLGSEEEPNMVVYSVFSAEEGYFVEPDYDHETVWDGNLDVFDGLRNPENWELGAITGVEETTFQGATAYSFTFRGGKFHGLLYSICDGIEGMSLIEDTIEWYYSASGGDNLEEFFDMEMLVCPGYGYVQFTITFTWESGQNYVISVASGYNPSIAQYTAAFEEAINPLCLAE